MMRGSITTALLLVLATVSARADLPAPDGYKFVGYELSVENTEAFPDYVLLAYPASQSDGVPIDAYQVVSGGAAASIGRRGGIPQIYAMKRADYESFKAGYQPMMQTSDPKLQELFKSARVTLCTGATPMPSFQLPRSDPRNAVTQKYRAESIDAKVCRLGPVPAPAPVTASATAPQPGPISDAPKPASHHGCGACGVVGTPSDCEPWSALAFLIAVAGAVSRSLTSERRRARRSPH